MSLSNHSSLKYYENRFINNLSKSDEFLGKCLMLGIEPLWVIHFLDHIKLAIRQTNGIDISEEFSYDPEDLKCPLVLIYIKNSFKEKSQYDFFLELLSKYLQWEVDQLLNIYSPNESEKKILTSFAYFQLGLNDMLKLSLDNSKFEIKFADAKKERIYKEVENILAFLLTNSRRYKKPLCDENSFKILMSYVSQLIEIDEIKEYKGEIILDKDELSKQDIYYTFFLIRETLKGDFINNPDFEYPKKGLHNYQLIKMMLYIEHFAKDRLEIEKNFGKKLIDIDSKSLMGFLTKSTITSKFTTKPQYYHKMNPYKLMIIKR